MNWKKQAVQKLKDDLTKMLNQQKTKNRYFFHRSTTFFNVKNKHDRQKIKQETRKESYHGY